MRFFTNALLFIFCQNWLTSYNFNFRAKYRYKSCCNGRNDPCSVEILGTLCYCDTFCNRTHNSDCCPDYFTHCEGLAELDFSNQKPPETLARPDFSKIIFDTYFHFPFTKSWTFLLCWFSIIVIVWLMILRWDSVYKNVCNVFMTSRVLKCFARIFQVFTHDFALCTVS